MHRLAAALIAALILPAQNARSAGNTAEACNDILRRFQLGQGELATPQLSALLFAAADANCTILAPDLIAAGASVATRDRSGGTALTHAARAGRTAMVQLLLAQGSDINQRDIAGSTPLFVAIEANRTQAARVLIEAGADIGTPGHGGVTPLAAAAYAGNAALVDMLLAGHADPSVADDTGKTAIVYAAARGFTPIIVRLLDAGLDVNAAYAHGLTVLAWAAGHADDVPDADAAALVRLLLQRGARADLVDDRGQTPSQIATDMGHASVLEALKGTTAAVAR